MTWRRLACWLAGPLAFATVACPVAAGAKPVGADVPPLTVPQQPIVSGPTLSTIVAPALTLHVVELPGRISAEQFRQVADEVEASTPARRTVLVLPSLVAMASPPSRGLVALLGTSRGANEAAVVVTPGEGSPTGVFNAAALFYARIPQRLLTGNVSLAPGGASEDWSGLQAHYLQCSSLCAPFSAGQAVPYAQLLAEGARTVRSDAEILNDLSPGSRPSITWEWLAPVSAAPFAPLFPVQHTPPAVVRRPSRRPSVHPGRGQGAWLFVVLGALLVATGLAGAAFALRGRIHRRLRPAPPSRRPSPPRPPHRTWPRQPDDANPLGSVLGVGKAVNATVRSGLSPDGYVEIAGCLVRATWSDSSPPPHPGAPATVRLLGGVLQASSAVAAHQATSPRSAYPSTPAERR